MTLAPISEDKDQVLRLKCIGNPFRLRLLSILRECCAQRTVGELCALLNMDQASLSHHLLAMRRAGLIACREKRGRAYYYPCEEVVRSVFAEAQQLAGLSSS